ncbi:MAG: hypothetical protein UV74_C0013G0205 [Candidatus Woesebacteria bacterium GW2011_GWB1_43_14]|uniref:Uncharacterized protein n=1 Tax=Candidatus Woesebacteria bacterium GW2011_GWB1_43_14 TaxID=1618578 RepID=A0A0G1GDY7_9BACT|nr:MAG: hypothetical protein UT21_C0005G0016 [Candidatus Woesebacteria bacterium GW2011_GWA1_39_11b]KKS77606.1 MAG: hypothetical protein UV51_C0005G0016 [Candidatus Woesebacteria bacterium GW2011_GWC1_42_9]KKS97083.1 MAG: hypothetical protein UV74_C0013G0205 [Candidatus Woesebacteria bacterium GW2011_GWB1_43_14]
MISNGGILFFCEFLQCCGRTRTRTLDPSDVNRMLYQLSYATFFVPRRGLEPPRVLPHTHLKRACLPVSTPRPTLKLRPTGRLCNSLVPSRGLEPLRRKRHSVLNAARLPVPPRRLMYLELAKLCLPVPPRRLINQTD